MSHHYQDPETKTELETVEEVRPEFSHPFFEKNDLTFLAMIKPLLSHKGQKLVGFFLEFGETTETKGNPPEFVELFRQLTGKNDAMKDLLPALLNLTRFSDDKSSFNPALLTTMLSVLSAKNNQKEG